MDLFKGNQGKGQGGFTLIELLVVIGILAVLAAVAIPAYSRFFGDGEAEANAAELSNIQASMDAMMANHRLLNVVVQTTATSIFDAQPVGCEVLPSATSCTLFTVAPGIDGPYEPLYPVFLRIGTQTTTPDKPTKMCYTWTETGFVTQVAGVAPDDTGTCS